MKDEELRAFLESASVSDEETQSMVVLPPAPGENASVDRAPSFDELINRGITGGSEPSPDETPVVLPLPPASGQRVPRQRDPQPQAAEPENTSLPSTEPIPAGLASTGAQAFGPSGAALTDADYEPIAVTGGDRKSRSLLPWFIVVGGAIIALVAAIFIVGALAGDNDTETPPVASPGPTEGNGEGSESPSTPPGNGDGESPGTGDGEPGGETPTEPGSDVPSVDVGPTQSMDIAHWGVQVDLSQKLGLSVQYSIMGENLELSSQLIDSYVEACGGTWGMSRVADNDFAVLKPAERCAEQPEVYDELWGLMDAMVSSARPL